MDNLLFIDDDLSILKTLQKIMSKEGYKLFFANSAKKALEIINKNDIAVIVSDNQMPGKSGIDLLSQVKSTSPYSIRILLSGDCGEKCAINSINLAHVYKFIMKPFQGHNLKAVIKTAVKKFHESKMIADLSNNNLSIVQAIQNFTLNRDSTYYQLMSKGDLLPGMTLNKDLTTDSGLLIAKKGHTFSFHDLEAIKPYAISETISILS